MPQGVGVRVPPSGPLINFFMATLTRESIAELHEKISVRLEKSDYLPAFERALKDWLAADANFASGVADAARMPECLCLGADLCAPDRWGTMRRG